MQAAGFACAALCHPSPPTPTLARQTISITIKESDGSWAVLRALWRCAVRTTRRICQRALLTRCATLTSTGTSLTFKVKRSIKFEKIFKAFIVRTGRGQRALDRHLLRAHGCRCGSCVIMVVAQPCMLWHPLPFHHCASTL